jgi:tetratricopeptide (TPR) repeat protein
VSTRAAGRLRRAVAVLMLAALTAAPACRVRAAGETVLPPGAEAFSLLGEPLYPPALTPQRRAELEGQLGEARSAHEADPADAEALIWLGRRLAYLGRYREAIDVYDRGLALHSDDPRFLRHRGHRWITLRRFDRAVEDLSMAAALMDGRPDEIEPDGEPNERGIPLTTLAGNIDYHLGLAHYLRGDFAAAAERYAIARDRARNPDGLVSSSYWLWLSLRRLGRESDAAAVLEAIHAEMEIIENSAYHRLLLAWRGGGAEEDALLEGLDPAGLEFATVGYGVGATLLLEGRRERAEALFRQIVQTGFWPAFGAIAAEAELARGLDG